MSFEPHPFFRHAMGLGSLTHSSHLLLQLVHDTRSELPARSLMSKHSVHIVQLEVIDFVHLSRSISTSTPGPTTVSTCPTLFVLVVLVALST